MVHLGVKQSARPPKQERTARRKMISSALISLHLPSVRPARLTRPLACSERQLPKLAVA